MMKRGFTEKRARQAVSLFIALLMMAGCKSFTGIAETVRETQESSVRSVEIQESRDGTSGAAAETRADEDAAGTLVRSSLTNEWVTREEEAKRPLAIMYPTDRKAQPQYGVDRAEIFYEIIEEEDMSRQMGIVKDWEDLPRIGNIRSIRDYYITIGLEWDPVFVHAGGPINLVKPLLTRADVDNLNGVGGSMGPEYGAFFRIPKGSKSEHTLYSDAAHMDKAIAKAGFQRTHKEQYQPAHFLFAEDDAPNDLSDYPEAADAVDIDMRGSFPTTKSVFHYNADDGKYYRSILGSPQKDAVSQRQLAFDNILIQYCMWGDRGLSYKMFQTIDSGRHGYFITRGKMIWVTWEKTDDYSPTRFFDQRGNEIRLNTGRTMINVVRIGPDWFTANGKRFE